MLVKTKAAHIARFFIGCLCCRQLSFNEFIRQQFQALDFCFFWAKPKERAPSAAVSREKPVKQGIYVLRLRSGRQAD